MYIRDISNVTYPKSFNHHYNMTLSVIRSIESEQWRSEVWFQRCRSVIFSSDPTKTQQKNTSRICFKTCTKKPASRNRIHQPTNQPTNQPNQPTNQPNQPTTHPLPTVRTLPESPNAAQISISGTVESELDPTVALEFSWRVRLLGREMVLVGWWLVVAVRTHENISLYI